MRGKVRVKNRGRAVILWVGRGDLTPPGGVETFLTDLTEWIEPKVVREGKEVPDTDHMYTLVTGIFFADKPVADSVKKKIRKYKYYKNYRFSLRGYCQVRLLVFDTAEQKVFGNRAAWELVKGYAKMFRS